MATDEAIFRGAPAEFESAVRVYDRQLGARLGVPLGTMLIFKTYFTPGVPQRLDIAEVCVAVSNLPLAEAALEPMGAATYTGPVLAWQWRATITAHALPDRRSHLFLQCEEAIWPGVEPHWQALIAELRRLGYIEAGEAEPEPVATEAAGRSGGKPSKQPIKYRAFWVHKLQESGLSAELFVVSEAGQGFSNGPEQLRRYAKEPEVIAYIEAHFHHRLEAK